MHYTAAATRRRPLTVARPLQADEQPCAECGRRYAHQHIRSLYARGGSEGGSGDDDDDDNERG